MRDPFEGVSVRGRKAMLLTAASAILLVAYGLVFPTQVAIVGVVLTLPLIIMLHEAGHFFTAKRTGMKVTEFFIGFGPRIWSFTRGETEYGVKAVVLGGYCRIIGMTNLEDVEPVDEPRAYRSKGYFARVLVAGAGPAVHFVIALVLMFSILFFAGDTRNERALTKLDQVTVGAKAAGLLAGDRIVAIGDKKITDWSQVAGAIEHHKAGDHVEIVVDRGGVPITKDVELTQQVFDGQTHVIAGISATIVVPHPGFFGSIAKAPGGVITVAARSGQRAGDDLLPVGDVEVLPRARRHRQEQGRSEHPLPVADRIRDGGRARGRRGLAGSGRSPARDQCVRGPGQPGAAAALRRGPYRHRDLREDLFDHLAPEGDGRRGQADADRGRGAGSPVIHLRLVGIPRYHAPGRQSLLIRAV